MIPLTIFCYVLISLTIISFMSIFKKDESGLIFGLIFGLISGLIYALIYVLIYALIFGLIFYGLTFSLIFYGLIYALISGLTFSLIFGLIYALIYWIKEKESLEEEDFDLTTNCGKIPEKFKRNLEEKN